MSSTFHNILDKSLVCEYLEDVFSRSTLLHRMSLSASVLSFSRYESVASFQSLASMGNAHSLRAVTVTSKRHIFFVSGLSVPQLCPTNATPNLYPELPSV